MKCLWKKVICGALVAGMLAQCPQSIYAEDAANTATVTDTESNHVTPDTTQQPDDTKQPDDTQQPGDIQQPDDIQQPEELPQPSAVEGLHTTKQGKTKVYLEWEESSDATFYVIYRKTAGGKYKKLAESSKPSYTDKNVSSGKTYTYKIVAKNEQKEADEAAKVTFSNTEAVQIRSQKYTYSQMKKDMQELAQQYSDYCEMTKIGTSVQGRGIYDFAIGNPDAEESLLIVSTLHAREYICSAVMMKEIQYYLENYNGTIGGVKMSNVLKKMQIHYIVMANPDGVTISQTKHSRWKSNGRGVDLNRNFPAKHFIPGGKKGEQGYSGPKALSEPESYAVATLTRQLIKQQNLQGVVNYHAMGRILYERKPEKRYL
ncbi:MAG: hypothetical protein J6P08_04205 [Agathobacter sp.]|nr:hypothetical protein [Agathobacter sp.]MDY6244026.1 M14 family zinc carboxypeptidase [Lachnospiraceae bacterium]MDY6313364.1 M14 family zinc carboxypeptidase [Lachnospiraceae bacterium]MDY6355079.1 M14 family zinc carboxypeptidase [Lachnospiraceae bacterium]